MEGKEKRESCKTGKTIYDKKSAQTLKNLTEKLHNIKMKIYECPECNHWHLTSVNAHREFRHAKHLTSKFKGSNIEALLNN